MSPELRSSIACPTCGFRREDAMPTDSCVFFYVPIGLVVERRGRR
jgi:hypothetical protein